MKLAVGTDNKKTIRRGHFGESQFYMIYEILNGEIFSEEIRKNPYVAQGKHKHGNTENIINLLYDCQLFMGRSMGYKSLPKIANKNIDAIITPVEQIKTALSYYLGSKDEYFKYYNAATGKFCNCTER